MRTDSKSKRVSSALKRVSTLYSRATRATRSGVLFNAFPYPTKVSPEAIALFIAEHTKPGDTVFDGFAGSGTTGLGALLCASPPAKLREEARRLGIKAKWGPRKAVLYELSSLGSMVSNVLCNPPDPDEFLRAANELLESVELESEWLYEAIDPAGQPGSIRYVIWSDIVLCPSCKRRSSLWNGCVSRNPANISSVFRCGHCKRQSPVDSITRITESVDDDLVGGTRRSRRREIAWIYGTTNGRMWSREASAADYKLVKKISKEAIPASVPRQKMEWGDLYRSGYHEGITHLHHFYTRRNLIVLGRLWESVRKFPSRLREALRFWLLSYNSSHSTLMTRVVAKKGQRDLVVTSGQPGVLYISGFPVEKNVFAGLRRKLGTITDAFKVMRPRSGLVEVVNASSLKLHLQTNSIDYVFTDPPFGGNIPYAEVNFLNEAWLGKLTRTKEEVIVSPHQGKTIDSYQLLLSKALSELHRVLKPKRNVTLVFHSSAAEVWNALRMASERAGFAIANTSVLEKTQGSFKQVTTQGAVRGDPMLLLTKAIGGNRNGVNTNVWDVADKLIKKATKSGEDIELTPQRLYSRLVAHYMEYEKDVPIGAPEFYRHISERLIAYGGAN